MRDEARLMLWGATHAELMAAATEHFAAFFGPVEWVMVQADFEAETVDITSSGRVARIPSHWEGRFIARTKKAS